MRRPSILLFCPSRDELRRWVVALGTRDWELLPVADPNELVGLCARLKPAVAVVVAPCASAVAQASPETLQVLVADGERDEALRWLPARPPAAALRAWVSAAVERAVLAVELEAAQAALRVAEQRRAERRSLVAPLRLDAAPGATVGSPVAYAVAKARALEAFEREYLAQLLTLSKGSISGAARMAGMDRCNFRRLVKRFRRATDREAA